MRLRIHATLSSRYSAEVSQAMLQARVSPAATARQIVLSHPLAAEPSGWQLAYDDYWGTRVVEIEVADAHSQFSISMLSDVNLTGLAGRPPAPDFSRLEAPGVEDSFTEFLRATPLTSVTEEQATLARELRQESGAPTDLVEHLSKELTSGSGPDDLTHLVIAALRSAGIPARFVSGYRAPFRDFAPGASAPGVLTSWLDYWDGAWQGWDPGVLQAVGEGHVIVGWGRDRADVPPLHGIYCGQGEAECTTEVQFTRLA